MFRLGFAMEAVDTEQHRVTTSVQLNHPNDNAENLGLGIEYAWNNTIMIRGGYRINVEEQRLPSFGIGVCLPVEPTTIAFDYAGVDYGLLGMSHRFSIGFSF
jgi:hypothetical protein